METKEDTQTKIPLSPRKAFYLLGIIHRYESCWNKVTEKALGIERLSIRVEESAFGERRIIILQDETIVLWTTRFKPVGMKWQVSEFNDPEWIQGETIEQQFNKREMPRFIGGGDGDFLFMGELIVEKILKVSLHLIRQTFSTDTVSPYSAIELEGDDLLAEAS